MAVNRESPPKSKTALAKQLGISRQSLYYQLKMPARDLALKAEIAKVMSDNRAYCHKRVAWALSINHKRSNRVMKLFGLKPQRRRKPPKKPKDQNQAPMVIPNLIKGIAIEAPNYVWVSDFTYLPYFGRFIYLATVEDLFTRKIVSWEVSIRHNSDLVVQALCNVLLFYRQPQIAHSDQGSEYRSRQYQNLLQGANIKPSMSEKASPWQNGHKESFYSEFKLELGHPECWPTLDELIEAIARQIHYYNNQRIHTALKCPPAVFARRQRTSQNPAIGQKELKLFPSPQKSLSIMPQDEPQKPETAPNTFQGNNIHLTFQEITEYNLSKKWVPFIFFNYIYKKTLLFSFNFQTFQRNTLILPFADVFVFG